MPDKKIKECGITPLSYNIRAAAAVLGISESNLRKLVRSGIVPSVRLQGRVLLPREALINFLRNGCRIGGKYGN